MDPSSQNLLLFLFRNRKALLAAPLIAAAAAAVRVKMNVAASAAGSKPPLGPTSKPWQCIEYRWASCC
mgnify:CR=1 FL=1